MQERIEAEKRRAQEYIEENDKLMVKIDEEVNGSLTYRDSLLATLGQEKSEPRRTEVSFGGQDSAEIEDKFIREEICDDENTNKNSSYESDNNGDQNKLSRDSKSVDLRLTGFAGMGEDSDLKEIDYSQLSDSDSDEEIQRGLIN